MSLLGASILRAAGATARLLPAGMKTGLYRTPLLSGLLRLILTVAAPEGLVEVEVASGVARGLRLRVDLKTQKYYWLGTHEMEVQAALLREVRPGIIAYDIGAQLGFFTLGLGRLVGPAGGVHSFEPAPENARALRENVSRNAEVADRISVVEAAVSDVCGRVLYSWDPRTRLGQVTPAGESAADFEVEGVTLDDYVFARKQPPPQFIKVDIDGSAGEALAGAGRVLREARPVLLVEMHGEREAAGVGEALRRAEYRVLTLDREREFLAPGEFAGGHILAAPRERS